MSCTSDFPVPRLTYSCIVYLGAGTRPGEFQHFFFSWKELLEQDLSPNSDILLFHSR